MKIVLLSDTHNKLKHISVPDGDVLIHAGDATGLGRIDELQHFNKCLKELPHKTKIFVPGNHDWLFQKDETRARELVNHATHILIDQFVEVDGLKFYGSPWTPDFYHWAFMKPRGTLHQVWEQIPENLDFLITHGPPYTILDKEYYGENCGCKELYDYVFMKKPRHHVFGHIHEAFGDITINGIRFINASCLDDFYKFKNEPVIIEI